MSCQERAQAAETWGKEPVGTSGGALLRTKSCCLSCGGEFLKLNGAEVHRSVFHLQYNNTGCISCSDFLHSQM